MKEGGLNVSLVAWFKYFILADLLTCWLIQNGQFHLDGKLTTHHVPLQKGSVCFIDTLFG